MVNASHRPYAVTRRATKADDSGSIMHGVMSGKRLTIVGIVLQFHTVLRFTREASAPITSVRHRSDNIDLLAGGVAQ